MNSNQSNPDKLERTFTFTYISDIMLKDNRLDKHDILTALGIAFFVDKNRVSWPGIPAIADVARLSERKVQTCISNLQKYGYLDIERRKDPKNPNRNLPNLYKILDVPLVHSVHQGGASHAPEQEPMNYNHKQQPTEPLSAVVKELKERGIELNKTVQKYLDTIFKMGLPENELGSYLEYIERSQPNSVSSKTGWIISQLPKRVQEYLDTQKKADPFNNGGVCPVCKKPLVASNSICPTCKATIAQMRSPLNYVAQNQGSLRQEIVERWKEKLQEKGLYLTPEQLKKEQEAGLKALKGLKTTFSA